MSSSKCPGNGVGLETHGQCLKTLPKAPGNFRMTILRNDLIITPEPTKPLKTYLNHQKSLGSCS